MKKFFNDHIGLFVLLSLAAAGVAIYLAVTNTKGIAELRSTLVGMNGRVDTLEAKNQ